MIAVTKSGWHVYEYPSAASATFTLVSTGTFRTAFTGTNEFPLVQMQDDGLATVAGNSGWFQINTGVCPKHRLIPPCRGTPPTQVDLAVTTGLAFLDTGYYITAGSGGYLTFPATWSSETLVSSPLNLSVFSFAFWYKTNQATTLYLMDCRFGSSGDQGFGIEENSSVLNFLSYVNNVKTTVSTGMPVTNTWRHVVITGDSSTYRIYVDTILRASATNSNPFRAFTSNSKFGAYVNLGRTDTIQCDDIAIYNRVLTSTEMESLFRGVDPSGISGCQFAWTFDAQNGNAYVGGSNLTVVTGSYSRYTTARSGGLVRCFTAIDNLAYKVYSNALNTVYVNQYNHTFNYMMQLQSIPQQVGANGIITLPTPRIVTGYIVTNGIGGSWTAQPTSKAATAWRLRGTNDVSPWSSLNYAAISGMRFNGTSSGAAVTSHFDASGTPWTFSCWFRATDSTLNGAFILDTRRAANLNGPAIELRSSNTIRIGNTTVDVSGCTWQDSAWHHMAYATNGTSVVKFYYDGTYRADASALVVNMGLPSVTLGTRYTTPTSAQYFQGYMEEIAVYNSYLDASSVLAIYQDSSQNLLGLGSSSSLIAYWKGDTSGLADSKGTRTLTNSNVSVVSMKPILQNPAMYPVRALTFNGTSSYAKVGTAYNYSGTPWAFTCWFKSSDPPKAQDGTFILDARPPGDGYAPYISVNHSNNSIGYPNDSASVVYTNINWLSLRWNHVVYTTSGSSSYSLYVNGSLIATVPISNYTGYLSLPNVMMGSRFSAPDGVGATQWFQGFMTEAAVYNVLFDASKVAAIYNNGALTDYRNIDGSANLVSYWKTLDNGRDLIGTRHLTLANTSYTSVTAPGSGASTWSPTWTTLHTVSTKSNMNAVYKIPNTTAYSSYQFTIDGVDGGSETLVQYTLQYSQTAFAPRVVTGASYVSRIEYYTYSGSYSLNATVTGIFTDGTIRGNSFQSISGVANVADSYVNQPYVNFVFNQSYQVQNVSVVLDNQSGNTVKVAIAVDTGTVVSSVLSVAGTVSGSVRATGTLSVPNYQSVTAGQGVRLYFYGTGNSGNVNPLALYEVVFNYGLSNEIAFY